MIKFHSPPNIIITKRSYVSTHSKNSEKKEKVSNKFFKDNYKINSNNYFNKNTLSLTNLKLKSKSKKKNNKNIVHSKAIKKSPEINLYTKKIKNENISNGKFLIKSNNINCRSNKNILNKKIKSNENNIYNYNYINNDENMLNNFINGNNIINSSPEPEPMPVKIIKNNYELNDRKISVESEYNYNYFSPSNIMSDNNNLDSEVNNNIYYNVKKAQSEKKYYSNLQRFFENNKKYKKNNINTLSNYNNFIQNINNNENLVYNKKFSNNIYDKRMIYILSNLNLDNLIEIFNSNCIGFNDLFLLTKNDLIEMKIPIGQRNRFIHFFDKFKNEAENYDFNEIKNYLDIYKQVYINNNFIEKNQSNISTISNFKNNNNLKDNIFIENKEDYMKKQNLFLMNNKENESKIIIKNNNLETQDNNNNDNKLYQINSSINNINISQTNKYIKNNSNKNSSKKDTINISIVQRNNKSEIETNKNSPSFSSISTSKVVLMDDLNYQDNNLLNKKNNQKNSSTITSNIEQNDTTVATINNKINSNHFIQKCNNILNEVDNFNNIYTQLKQKAQNRNKQISLLLNKKNNMDYFKEKIKYKNLIDKTKEINNVYNNNDIYRIDNYYSNAYNIDELNSLKEESIRDLNKELQINSFK